jgi:hypothetical protein
MLTLMNAGSYKSAPKKNVRGDTPLEAAKPEPPDDRPSSNELTSLLGQPSLEVVL